MATLKMGSRARARPTALEQGLATCDTIFTRGALFEHAKVTICHGESASGFEDRLQSPQLCEQLTSLVCDERAQLTCRCSSARRLSHKSSVGPSCPTYSDSAPSMAASAGT